MIEVPDDKIIPFFNKMVHRDVHKNVKHAYPFIKFPELSYEEIINHYLTYFSSSFENDLHKSRFICRKQYENETIVIVTMLIVEINADCLQKIYYQCRFISRMEEELCEKFINGIRNDDLRNYLIKSPSLLFDETILKAIEFSKSDLISYYLVPALSKISSYNQTMEGLFYAWLNRFEYVENNIKEPYDKMVELFNEMVDNKVYRRVKKIFLSVNFAELSYKEIINYYLRYFSLSRDTNLHRSRFMCRKQYEEESIENYANSLRKIFSKCYYVDHTDERLREQFCKKFASMNYSNISRFFARGNQITMHLNQALSMIHIYNPKKEGMFYVWLNKFEYETDVLNVPDHKMVEFFIKMIDKDLQMSAKMSFPCVNFSQLSYEMIINYYLRYFAISNKTDLHRKRFKCRDQYKNETIDKYAKNLKKIYNKCDDKSNLEEKLCKKFLNEILDKNIRNVLIKMAYHSMD
ncbi:hypothetical protein M0804_013391 [Polistes exclamans]|nr:hypothetical protein M0804_013391 [Polistes exclamans]